MVLGEGWVRAVAHRAGPREVARYEVATCVRRDPGGVAGGGRLRRMTEVAADGDGRAERAGHPRLLGLRGGRDRVVPRDAGAGLRGREPERRPQHHRVPRGQLRGEARHGDRGGQGARPRPGLRSRADARRVCCCPLDDMVAGERHRPLDVRAGDRRSPATSSAAPTRATSTAWARTPGSVQMLYNKDLFDAAGIDVPGGVAADDARGVRRHRLPAHRRGERGLGRRGLGPARVRPVRHDVQPGRARRPRAT